MELPETLLIAKQMDTELKGKQIQKTHINLTNPNFTFLNVPLEEFMALTENSEIVSVYAKAKWIFTKLHTNMILAISPEMGGDILYHKDDSTLPTKFHFKFEFKDGSLLTIKFAGFVFAKIGTKEELESQKYPGKLGLSPIDENYTLQHFSNLFKDNNKMVKSALLDNGNLPGVANYYLNEAFFTAKIHPKQKTPSFSEKAIEDLFKALRAILYKAIEQNGRSERKDLYGKNGHYMRIIGPKNKEKPCLNCKTRIIKLSVAGSNNYICPNCQRLD